MTYPTDFNWTGLTVLAVCATVWWLCMVVRDLRAQKLERDAQR